MSILNMTPTFRPNAGIIWCSNCIFFKETGQFDGLCFYNPPVVTDNNLSLRPVVTREEFCSKFEEYP